MTAQLKREKMYKLLAKVPRGKIISYGEFAKILKTSPRVIGAWCSRNSYAPRVPCHRVVMSDAGLGGFTHPQGIKKKIELLEKEGIEVKNGKIVDFEKHFYKIEE